MAKVTNLLRPYDSASAAFKKGAGGQMSLTFALLETVRMVLEEGQDTEDEEKHSAPLSHGHDDHNNSSDHTSSDSYLPRNRRPAPKLSGILGGPCAHCGATESPQWRRPLTKKVVLCNACGIYYSRHHSLPKRKKISPPKHSAFDAKEEDSGAEQEREHAPIPATMFKSEPMCPAPQQAQRSPSPAGPPALPTDSTSSADCIQHEALKPALTPLVSTPTNSVGTTPAPAVSSGSLALCSSLTAPGSRGKRPRADFTEPQPEGVAKRGVKRVAAKAATKAALLQAMPGTPGGSPKAGSPDVSDADAAARRPVVTTAVASVHTPVKAAEHGNTHAPFTLLTGPHPDAPTGQPRAKGAHSEQSADSDVAMILIPMTTCRGPRQSISLKTAHFWP